MKTSFHGSNPQRNLRKLYLTNIDEATAIHFQLYTQDMKFYDFFVSTNFV